MFIQVMDFRTTRREEMAALEEQWRSDTEGVRRMRRVVIGQDQKDSNHYVLMAFYDDHEAALADAALTETTFAADRHNELIPQLPTFLDLDVIKDVEY